MGLCKRFASAALAATTFITTSSISFGSFNNVEAAENKLTFTVMCDATVVTEENGAEAFYKQLEEELDCNINWTRPDHYSYYDSVKASLSSANMPDVVLLNSDYLNYYANKGILWDMTDAWNNSKTKNSGELSDYAIKYIEENGTAYNKDYKKRMFGFSPQRGNGCCTYVKSSYLKAIGYDPETVKNSDLTYEEYYDILSKIKKLNPDSYVISTPKFALTDRPYTNYLPDFYQNSKWGFYMNEDGEYVDGFTEQAMRDALKRIATAVSDGIINENSYMYAIFEARNDFRDKSNSGTKVFSYWNGFWGINLRTTIGPEEDDGGIVVIKPVNNGKYIERRTQSWAIVNKADGKRQLIFDKFIDTMLDGGNVQMLWTCGAKGTHWDSKAETITVRNKTYTYKEGEFHFLPKIDSPSVFMTKNYIDRNLSLRKFDENTIGVQLYNEQVNSKFNKIMDDEVSNFLNNSEIEPLTPCTESYLEHMNDINEAKLEYATDAALGRLTVDEAMTQYRSKVGSYVDSILDDFKPYSSQKVTGTWGTCKWTYEDGVLTIGGGVGASCSKSGDRPWNNYYYDINKIVITGKITFASGTSLNQLFANMNALKSIEGLTNLDTSNVISMKSMFYNCSLLTSLDVSSFDTSKVTDMSYMFGGSENIVNKLASIDVSGFDTSKVTNMSGMFYNCSALKSLDLSSFDTSNVTNMSYMFAGSEMVSEGLVSINLDSFDTSKVTNMSNMFYGCSNLASINLSGFDTSKVTNMSYMFYNCSNLISIDLSGFDTRNVTDMSCMFFKSSKLKSLDLSSFDTGKVTTIMGMFGRCGNLLVLDMSSFDLSSVHSALAFLSSTSFAKIKLPKRMNDSFSKDLKANMRSGSWIDETTGTEYKDAALIELSDGHAYKYVTEKLSANVTSSSTGDGNLLSVQAQGGMPYYTYKYIMYNPKTDKWTLLSDYGSSNTYTLNMTGSGDRIIYVDVMDAIGNVTRASATVILTGQEELSVTASKTESDNQVVFTADAAGGSSDYTYKFIVYNKTTGTWGIVQNYSSKNTCTWTKGSAGDRDFYVDVKDSDGNVVRSQAMNVKIESTKPTAVLTPSATTLSVGGKLTLTASTDKSGCTYKFLIYNPSTNQWFKLQDFSSKNTYTWTAGSNGTRQFYVDVKDSNGNVTRSKVVNVTIGGEGILSVKTAVSANTTKVGDKVTFTAEGAGGKAGYTYKMIVYNKTTKTWGLVQNFSSNNKITWTAGSAGDREFYIDVKDADGNVVRSSVMNVKTSN